MLGIFLPFRRAFRIKENAFHIPIGILHTDIFNEKWPKFMNYGGIGSIIGHEIIHGFDSSGKNYDEEGNKHINSIIP